MRRWRGFPPVNVYLSSSGPRIGRQGALTASGSPSPEGLREICRILVALSFVVLVIRCARVITSILELVRGTQGPERSNEGFNHSFDGIAVIFYSCIAHMTSKCPYTSPMAERIPCNKHGKFSGEWCQRYHKLQPISAVHQFYSSPYP